MMTAESLLSKRPFLRFAVALFFLLKLFSSHIYFVLRTYPLFFPWIYPNKRVLPFYVVLPGFSVQVAYVSVRVIRIKFITSVDLSILSYKE